MDSLKLYDDMRKTARRALDEGFTPKEVRDQAKDQDASGFSVSADFTRLKASMMEQLQQEEAQSLAD